MKTIVSAIVALVMSVSAANALTLKKGEVLTDSGVVAAGETNNAKRNLANKGYHIGGGSLFLDVSGVTVEISLDDLKGKSKPAIKELIMEVAGEELSSATHDVALEAEFESAGIAVADTVEEAMNSGGVETAVNTANEAVAAAVEQAAHDYVNDPDGVNAEAIADGHEICTGSNC